MSTPQTVEQEARARAGHALSDGAPILDRPLLLRCAEQIEHLKAALADIARNGPRSGGIWAKQRAQAALDRPG